MKHKANTNPPGRRKIIDALTDLMRTKDFQSITTAEIARLAGVTEGLIYKYFDSKKDMLYQVLNDLFTQFQRMVLRRIADVPSAVDKLKIIIFSSIQYYVENRVFARMLLLEVRNSTDYFNSEAYNMVQIYARNILDVIEDGMRKGELKSDTDPLILRKIILGAIEHACLAEIIFSKDLDAQVTTDHIATILFNGARA